MKKIYSLIMILIIIFPLISAINLQIEKQSENEVLIKDLSNPVFFDLKITNLGESDTFKIYNLIGLNIEPETIQINAKETKEIELKVSLIGDLNFKGFYSFDCTFRGKDESEISQQLTLNLIELEDAFEIGANEFDSEASSLKIYIKNKIDFDFEEINAEFSSPFFKVRKTFTLAPNEKKEFNIQLKKEEFKELMAGIYTLKSEVLVEDKKANVEGNLKFVEKNIVTTTEDNYGIIVSTKTIEKTNEGNVLVNSETVLKKNILSRLFTNFNIQPDIVDRKGLMIYYIWNREIKPGETLKIVMRTNWLFPLLIIFFIVAIVALAKQYSKTNLSLSKKVSFIKAKGGEFALKISVIIKAKNYVENVRIYDKLPPLVKIHERFGGEIPKRINLKLKRVEWEFDKLEAGERRIISYIIYSKIGVLGKFALPTTTAVYEREGKTHESQSNRAFFIAEQKMIEEED